MSSTEPAPRPHPIAPTADTQVAGRRRTAESLGPLYEGHRAPLLRYLEALTQSREDAKEIYHDACAKLISLDALDTVALPERYLWRTAHNLARDRKRERAVRIRLNPIALFNTTNPLSGSGLVPRDPAAPGAGGAGHRRAHTEVPQGFPAADLRAAELRADRTADADQHPDGEVSCLPRRGALSARDPGGRDTASTRRAQRFAQRYPWIGRCAWRPPACLDRRPPQQAHLIDPQALERTRQRPRRMRLRPRRPSAWGACKAGCCGRLLLSKSLSMR